MEYERYADVYPSSYIAGSHEEMIGLLRDQARAWVETEGAMEWAQSKILKKV